MSSKKNLDQRLQSLPFNLKPEKFDLTATHLNLRVHTPVMYSEIIVLWVSGRDRSISRAERRMEKTVGV